MKKLLTSLILLLSTAAFGEKYFTDIVIEDGKVQMKERAAAPASISTYGFIYPRTDKKLYFLDSNGTEFNMLLAGAASMDDIINVDTSGVATGDVLVYDGTNWVDSDILKATDGAVVVGSGNASPSSIFSVFSTDKGSQPCVAHTTISRDAIVSPDISLCVYNTDALEYQQWDGTQWRGMGGGAGISNWISGVAYVVDEVVVYANKIFQAITAHTSSVFDTDYNVSGFWKELANGITSATSSTTINAIPKWADSTGDLITNSAILIEASNSIVGVGRITATESAIFGYLQASDNTIHALNLSGDINLIPNDAGKVKVTNTNGSIEIGSTDAFSRRQIWNNMTNASLRLGALAQDGDPTDVNSEGIVAYGANSQGTAINSATGDFGYARVKADSFGLYTSIANVANYYFRVDPTSLYLRDDSFAKTFEVTRSTGSIDTILAAGVVKSNASGILSSNLVDLSSEVGSVLPEVNGGTDQSSYITGDTIYASAANTLSKRAAGAEGYVYTMIGGVPDWAAPAGGGSGGAASTSQLVVGMTANRNVYTDATGTLVTANAANDGQFQIGATGSNPVIGQIVGTASQTQIVNGAGTIQVKTAQDIGSDSLVTFGRVTLRDPLTLANGGLGGSLIASAGGIVYGTATATKISAAGVQGQALISGGVEDPTWFAPASGSVVVAGVSGKLDSAFSITNGDRLNVGSVKVTSANYASTPCNPVTSAQKTTIGASLGSGDKGQCVYDTDLLTTFTWNGSAWIQLSTATAGQYYAGTLSGADVDLGTTADGGTWNNAANASLTTLTERKKQGNITCATIGSGNVGVTCSNVTAGLKEVCFDGVRDTNATLINQSFRVASCTGSSVCSTTVADDYSETWSDTFTLATNVSGQNQVCKTVEVFTSGTVTFNLQETTDTATVVTTNKISANSSQRKIGVRVKDASGGGGGGGASVAVVMDEKDARTNGGTFTSGSWATRDLVTFDYNLGPELVTNGTFATDISGWTVGANNSWVSGTLQQTYNSGGGDAYQTVAVTSGQKYTFRVRSRMISGAGNTTIKVYDGVGTGGTLLISKTNASTSWVEEVITLTATSGNVTIQFYNNGDPVTMQYDDVSLRLKTVSTYSFVSLSGNVLTLQPGKYHIHGSAPAYGVDGHKARLYNNTDGMIVPNGAGTTERSSSTDTTATRSHIDSKFEISGVKNIVLQHFANTTEASVGYGESTNVGEYEVYSHLTIEKLP